MRRGGKKEEVAQYNLDLEKSKYSIFSSAPKVRRRGEEEEERSGSTHLTEKVLPSSETLGIGREKRKKKLYPKRGGLLSRILPPSCSNYL